MKIVSSGSGPAIGLCVFDEPIVADRLREGTGANGNQGCRALIPFDVADGHAD